MQQMPRLCGIPAGTSRPFNAEMCQAMGRGSAGFDEANEIRNRLWELLNHYKATLDSHGLPLPFSN
jgi:hypothetical protein